MMEAKTEFIVKLNQLVSAAMRCGFTPTGSQSEREAAEEVNRLTLELMAYVEGLEEAARGTAGPDSPIRP